MPLSDELRYCAGLQILTYLLCHITSKMRSLVLYLSLANQEQTYKQNSTSNVLQHAFEVEVEVVVARIQSVVDTQL